MQGKTIRNIDRTGGTVIAYGQQGKGVMLDTLPCAFFNSSFRIQIFNGHTELEGQSDMCGIVGYTGHVQAAPILLDGLARLEYRGYDSAGLAVRNGTNPAEVVKATGKLYHLADKTDQGRALPGTCGIGHTRWATHGDPSMVNAHPHVSGNCSGSGSGTVESDVVGVHNGIIENFTELKEKLLRHDYTFYSETDTEVVVKLVDYYYKKYKIGPVDAITRTMVRVRGSYALALMFKDYPDEIFVARKDSPLVIGTADGASYLASDVPAILKYTRSVYYIDNLQVGRISAGDVKFYDLNGDEVKLPLTEITWDAAAAEKDGYEHFMLKEIHEQPKAVRDTLNSLVKDGKITLEETGLTDEMLQSVSRVDIVACGSAWHVGMAAQYVIEDLAKIPVRVELASEYRYRSIPVAEDTLVIVISQSGETADSLAALRVAKERPAGCHGRAGGENGRRPGPGHRRTGRRVPGGAGRHSGPDRPGAGGKAAAAVVLLQDCQYA